MWSYLNHDEKQGSNDGNTSQSPSRWFLVGLVAVAPSPPWMMSRCFQFTRIVGTSPNAAENIPNVDPGDISKRLLSARRIMSTSDSTSASAPFPVI
mmetsp:Transcript_1811/g.1909  ORF Transcript_1811/g.1909 Transcript_1811/m.1909 type:complete len:96 (-) Transcript_1811:467-754(-)